MSRGASRAASIIAVVVLVIAVAAVLLYVTGQSRQAPSTTSPSTSTAATSTATSTATSAQDVALYAVAYKDITAGLLVTVLNYLILGKPLEGFNIGGLKG